MTGYYTLDQFVDQIVDEDLKAFFVELFNFITLLAENQLIKNVSATAFHLCECFIMPSDEVLAADLHNLLVFLINQNSPEKNS